MRVPEAVKRQQEQMDAFDAAMTAAPGETPPATEPPADPPPAPPPTPPTEVDWQQKFQTLQGKYNAEVPSLRNQVAELSRQVQDLTAARPAPTPEPAPAPAVATLPKLITDEDTETYGNDLIDLIRRVAVETDAGEKAKLQGEIAELRKQMTANAAQVERVQGNVEGERRATYFTDLAKACPTYEAVDNSDEFKAWLLETDDFSGIVRNEILQQRYHAFDASGTAKIFNAYLAGATPSPTPTPTAEPAVTPQDELALQVSPGQARASTPITPDTDAKKIWTVGEMDVFYKDVARGDYRGRRAEVERIEAEIDRALAEGRVRN
jgi:hypothetical protein